MICVDARYMAAPDPPRPLACPLAAEQTAAAVELRSPTTTNAGNVGKENEG
jgi:hypothetical protein